MVVSAPVAIAFLVVSIADFVVSAIFLEVSVEVDTEVESAVVVDLLELQAATVKVRAKAKKPNLNEFFMLFSLLLKQ